MSQSETSNIQAECVTEGSITAAYIQAECVTYCNTYFNDEDTMGESSRVGRSQFNLSIVFNDVQPYGSQPLRFSLSLLSVFSLPEPSLSKVCRPPFAAVRPPQTAAPVPFEPPSSSLHSWVGGRTPKAAVKERSTLKGPTAEVFPSPELRPPAAIAGEPWLKREPSSHAAIPPNGSFHFELGDSNQPRPTRSSRSDLSESWSRLGDVASFFPHSNLRENKPSPTHKSSSSIWLLTSMTSSHIGRQSNHKTYTLFGVIG
ncbi:hypothetical protein ACLB2K_046968 [Fragaria x ananassa]